MKLQENSKTKVMNKSYWKEEGHPNLSKINPYEEINTQ